jgi:hypothetical protein
VTDLDRFPTHVDDRYRLRGAGGADRHISEVESQSDVLIGLIGRGIMRPGAEVDPPTFIRLRQRRPRKRAKQKQERETQARDGSRKRLVETHRQFPPRIAPNGGDKSAGKVRLHPVNLSSEKSPA